MGLINLVIAAAIVFGGWWLLKFVGKAKPVEIKAMIRKAGGAGLMAAAAFLSLRGQAAIAAPLFAVGLGLFTNVPELIKQGMPWSRGESRKSTLRTSILAMELDHETGAFDGAVLSGRLAGRRLSSLTAEELSELQAYCSSAGDQSAALLATWLQRVRPGHAQQGPGSQRQAAPGAGRMTREEAMAVLGLKGNPSAEDIKAAHRKLMKQFHPDAGGSDYLASKINLAKDTLLQA